MELAATYGISEILALQILCQKFESLNQTSSFWQLTATFFGFSGDIKVIMIKNPQTLNLPHFPVIFFPSFGLLFVTVPPPILLTLNDGHPSKNPHLAWKRPHPPSKTPSPPQKSLFFAFRKTKVSHFLFWFSYCMCYYQLLFFFLLWLQFFYFCRD